MRTINTKVPFVATFSGRRQGAIGSWSNIKVYFSIDGVFRTLTKVELIEAAIKAAHQFGWEVNHVNSIKERVKE